MPCFSMLKGFHTKMAIAWDKLQLPIRNYPVQENGNGAKVLTKIRNICGLQFRKYKKATKNRTTPKWLSGFQRVEDASVYTQEDGSV